MRHDILADVLSSLRNADHVGKKETITPASKLAKEILIILQKNEYIGNFELVENRKGNMFKIELFGKINKCGVIKPRFSVKADGYERFERRFLPSSGVGMLIVSTSKGILPFTEAKKLNIGGKLLAFIY
ncbi:MAG: 30S ribosomal protein S8 [Nanoarchaeota archaeon]|nr:30S ribosomal protein S8 [Nanoarchaeota archaeon]MBU4123941.1 30S ribosomal protein S8 [Nanoarchaeota archaeon]